MNKLSDLLEIEDLWTHLTKSSKKIVLYGMGDGADKILDVCNEKGIEVCGVFASDEFVRYQSFRGFTVKKYSELKNEFSDMIIPQTKHIEFGYRFERRKLIWSYLRFSGWCS